MPQDEHDDHRPGTISDPLPYVLPLIVALVSSGCVEIWCSSAAILWAKGGFYPIDGQKGLF